MKSVLLGFLCSAITIPLWSHESLYNTAEIHLTSADTVRIHFSIHAPELLFDLEQDTTDFGDEWLAGLDDETIATLIDRSRKFVLRNFQLEADDLLLLEKFPLEFETSDLIRAPRRENGPRPGCLLATLTFPNPGGELQLTYSTKAEKRLLLVEIRPAAFPGTYDMASGESGVIRLPEPPPTHNAGLTFAPAVELVSTVESPTTSLP